MIVHLAPRRVTLVSKDGGRQTGIPIDLSAVLAVDIQRGPAKQVAVIVRLTNGQRIIAAVYPQMVEAGPDCGRLRVLAGLPAWSDLTDPPALTPPWPPFTAIIFRLATAIVALVLTAVALRSGGSLLPSALIIAISD